MNAAQRRWHLRIWIVVGLLAIIGLGLGVALRPESAIGTDAGHREVVP